MSTTTTQLENGNAQLSYELPVRQDAAGLANPEQKPSESKRDLATYLKLISAGFSFFVAGVNDGSIGALVPYIIRDYGLNTAIVSSVYVPASPLGLTALGIY